MLKRRVVLKVGKGDAAPAFDLAGADLAKEAEIGIDAQVRAEDAAEELLLIVIAAGQ